MAAGGDHAVEKLKIFVGGMDWKTTKEGLKTHFESFGDVTDAVVMKDNDTPRGFGFVTFKDPESVERALSNKDHVLDSKKVDPKPALLKSSAGSLTQISNERDKKIFLGGIDSNTTEDQVRESLELALGKCNTVSFIDIKTDKVTRRNKGFGFVAFSDEHSVKMLVEKRFVSINGKMVECKKAEPRNTTTKQKSDQQPYTVSAHYQRGGFVPYSQYTAADYSYQQQQQQQPQQQQPQQFYGSYYYQPPTATTNQFTATNQYGTATDRYGGAQQGTTAVQSQQISPYTPEGSSFSTRSAGYSAPESYAAQGGYNTAQTSAVYPQYGDTQTSSNYNQSMGQGQQRSFY